MEHGKQQVMLSRSYWILFLFMILFDPPVWQCSSSSWIYRLIPKTTNASVAITSWRRTCCVCSSPTSLPHNLRDRTSPIAIHYMFHMDDHCPAVNVRDSCFYASVSKDRLFPPSAVANAEV